MTDFCQKKLSQNFRKDKKIIHIFPVDTEENRKAVLRIQLMVMRYELRGAPRVPAPFDPRTSDDMVLYI